MPSALILIWDYDTAIGQVNATLPYNFNERHILDEITNTDTILALAKELDLLMTFACVGFAAEEGHFPYHIPGQIRSIAEHGHEVASHSWKHEWLPYLSRQQLCRTIARSKLALERCIGRPHSVVGFVPPFNRPMTWLGRGAISLGDRTPFPFFPAGDISRLSKLLCDAGYSWGRFVFRPIWRKAVGRPPCDAILQRNGFTYFPIHVSGFGKHAIDAVDQAVQRGRPIVVCGHPSGLSRGGEENIELFRPFMHHLARLRDQKKVVVRRARDYVAELA